MLYWWCKIRCKYSITNEAFVSNVTLISPKTLISCKEITFILTFNTNLGVELVWFWLKKEGSEYGSGSLKCEDDTSYKTKEICTDYSNTEGEYYETELNQLQIMMILIVKE